MGVTFHHLSMNVSDLERSTRFYCEGLGFEVVGEETYSNIKGDTGVQIERRGADMRFVVRTLAGHGLTMNFNHPQVTPIPFRRAEDQHGFSNWAFSVDDLDQTLAGLCALGGREKPNSRNQVTIGNEITRIVICFDPDGENIELIETRRID